MGATASYAVKGTVDTTLSRITVDGVYVHKVVKELPNGEAEMEIATDRMSFSIGDKKESMAYPPSRVVLDKYGSYVRRVGDSGDDKQMSLNAFRYISYLGQKLELNKAMKISQKSSGRTLYEGTQKLVELTAAQAVVESAFDVYVQQPKGKFKLKAKTVYDVTNGMVISTTVDMSDIPTDPARMSVVGANLTMTLIK